MFVRSKFILILLITLGIIVVSRPRLGLTESRYPAVFEFGAGYCVSCKEMEKVMTELKTTMGDKVEFRMVYADKEKPLFQQHKIMLIPTQIFFNAQGKEIDRHVGALTKEQVLSKLKELKFIEP
jgi:thiol-disulfide isomerase/thioredoxin